MVKVGFLVEGSTEKKLVESPSFRDWARNSCGIEVVDPVAVAEGPLSPGRVADLAGNLKLAGHPDKIVILVDLDPDEAVPCITERKIRIGSAGADLVLIAKPAIEAWFLADTEAMRKWSGNPEFKDDQPERFAPPPWERLKAIRTAQGRGPGATKVIFARKFIRDCGFSLPRAAEHPACPSAAYAVARLDSLGGGA